jgi:hypothetical protein
MSQADARDAARLSSAQPPLPEGLAVSLNLLLILASLATAGVALWLFWVTSTVLPTHDPAHIPMWRGVALCFLAYSALSCICVAAGQGNPPLRWAVGVTSLAAVALGLYGVGDMFRRASTGGDVEGYILLMGIILAGHGITGLLHALLIPRARAVPLG